MSPSKNSPEARQAAFEKRLNKGALVWTANATPKEVRSPTRCIINKLSDFENSYALLNVTLNNNSKKYRINDDPLPLPGAKVKKAKPSVCTLSNRALNQEQRRKEALVKNLTKIVLFSDRQPLARSASVTVSSSTSTNNSSSNGALLRSRSCPQELALLVGECLAQQPGQQEQQEALATSASSRRRSSTTSSNGIARRFSEFGAALEALPQRVSAAGVALGHNMVNDGVKVGTAIKDGSMKVHTNIKVAFDKAGSKSVKVSDTLAADLCAAPDRVAAAAEEVVEAAASKVKTARRWLGKCGKGLSKTLGKAFCLGGGQQPLL